MANQLTIFNGDLAVNGYLRANTFALPANSVSDGSVIAASGIQASKLQHQHQAIYCGGDSNTTAVTNRQVIHVVIGATGTIVAFAAGSVVANIGAATVSIRLKKNGSNIDTAALVLDSGNTAFILESAAGFTSTSLVVGDVLEVDITATAGGGTLAKGVFAVLTIREDAQ